jgi:hypothetical protein
MQDFCSYRHGNLMPSTVFSLRGLLACKKLSLVNEELDMKRAFVAVVVALVVIRG